MKKSFLVGVFVSLSNPFVIFSALGTGIAIAFGTGFQRKLSKAKKK